MQFQNDSFSCGIYSCLNAAEILGLKLDVSDIQKFTNTSFKNGTSELGVKRALQQNGIGSFEFHTHSFDDAEKFLDFTEDGFSVIICIDKWDHWVLFLGSTADDKFVIFDSKNTSRNRRNKGVVILSKARFKKLWKFKDQYFGIVAFRNS